MGICILAEAEKKREAKQRAREAQERELRKREKAEEKERRRKEYDALKASKREQEKKPKKETNQAPSKFSLSSKVVAMGTLICVQARRRPQACSPRSDSQPSPKAWDYLGGFAHGERGALLGSKCPLACLLRGACLGAGQTWLRALPEPQVALFVRQTEVTEKGVACIGSRDC